MREISLPFKLFSRVTEFNMKVVWEQLSNMVGRRISDPNILILTMGLRVRVFPTLAPFTMVELEVTVSVLSGNTVSCFDKDEVADS